MRTDVIKSTNVLCTSWLRDILPNRCRKNPIKMLNESGNRCACGFGAFKLSTWSLCRRCRLYPISLQFFFPFFLLIFSPSKSRKVHCFNICAFANNKICNCISRFHSPGKLAARKTIILFYSYELTFALWLTRYWNHRCDRQKGNWLERRRKNEWAQCRSGSIKAWNYHHQMIIRLNFMDLALRAYCTANDRSIGYRNHSR